MGRLDGGGVISFDMLIRILTNWFHELLPQGWTIHGSGRSDGIRLRIPESRSEEDYAIHMGWIVASDRPGCERLLAVTRAALADLQTAVIDVSGAGWPSRDDPDRPSEQQVEIAGDHINPRLRLFYGSPGAPVVELTPAILLNSVLYEQA